MTNTEMKNGRLFKITDCEPRIIPHPSEHKDLIVCALKAIGHGAFRKILEQLRTYFSRESMATDVQKTIRCCKE